MSKKKLFMIIIVAVICVAALSVALVMVRGKKEKSINLGKSSEETDEQSYWNPDIHGIAKSEDGYYYLTYDIDGTTLRYFDDTAKKSIAVCASLIVHMTALIVMHFIQWIIFRHLSIIIKDTYIW